MSQLGLTRIKYRLTCVNVGALNWTLVKPAAVTTEECLTLSSGKQMWPGNWYAYLSGLAAGHIIGTQALGPTESISLRPQAVLIFS